MVNKIDFDSIQQFFKIKNSMYNSYHLKKIECIYSIKKKKYYFHQLQKSKVV